MSEFNHTSVGFRTNGGKYEYFSEVLYADNTPRHPHDTKCPGIAGLVAREEYDEMVEEPKTKRIGPWWCRLTIWPYGVGWTLSAHKLQIRWDG